MGTAVSRGVGFTCIIVEVIAGVAFVEPAGCVDAFCRGVFDVAGIAVRTAVVDGVSFAGAIVDGIVIVAACGVADTFGGALDGSGVADI